MPKVVVEAPKFIKAQPDSRSSSSSTAVESASMAVTVCYFETGAVETAFDAIFNQSASVNNRIFPTDLRTLLADRIIMFFSIEFVRNRNDIVYSYILAFYFVSGFFVHFSK